MTALLHVLFLTYRITALFYQDKNSASLEIIFPNETI
jgi:hypothetical protein